MRPSSARPQAAKRASVSSRDHDFVYDCKAAYLVVNSDVQEPLLSKKHLTQALQSAGRNPTQRQIEKYWTKSNEITFDEFVDICRELPVTTEDDLLKAFKKIDINGDGFLSNSELRKTLTTRGEKMTREEVQAVIDEVDENRDGKLNYIEFCKMVLGTQEECRQLAARHMEKSLQGSRTKVAPQPRKRSTVPSQPEPSTEADSDSDSDGVVITTSKSSLRRDSGKQIRGLGVVHPALSQLDLKLSEPSNIREWHMSRSKGCFFFDDDDAVISHQYSMRLSRDAQVFITIEPMPGRQRGREIGAPVDTLLFILRDDNSVVSFTEMRDMQGRFGVRQHLEKGRYRLVPFSSGCRMRRRKSESGQGTKLVSKKGGQYVLTTAFKEALSDIFDLCDLDGNGLLSRDEFNLFNVRTSGEGVVDSEWQVVEDSVELDRGEVTLTGFIQLNQLEADDNNGDTDDLWVTLSSMGFNKSLIMDEAFPFTLQVFSDSCEARMKVEDIGARDKYVDRALVEETMRKGESSPVTKDLTLQSLHMDTWTAVALQNKSHHESRVKLDSSRSKNCVISVPSSQRHVSVPGRTSTLGLIAMPSKESKEWQLCVDASTA